MAEFCVKYGAMHETTLRRAKSKDAAISAAAEKWRPPTDLLRDHAVIVEVQPGGKEEVVVDTPQLLTLIQQYNATGRQH